MKKLLILLMAFSLFTACNNDKGKYSRDDRNSNNREKDDYSNKDDRSNDDKTSNNDKRSEEDKDTKDYTSKEGWTQRDKDKFMDECLGGFASNQQALGKKICPCALDKFEKRYASLSDVNEKAEEAEGKKYGKECAEEMNINSNNVNKDANDNTGNSTATNWPDYEVSAYLKTCVSGVVNNGMNKYDAQSYCECMQIKMEKRFPDIKVVEGLTEGEILSISKKYAPGCLQEH